MGRYAYRMDEDFTIYCIDRGTNLMKHPILAKQGTYNANKIGKCRDKQYQAVEGTEVTYQEIVNMQILTERAYEKIASTRISPFHSVTNYRGRKF